MIKACIFDLDGTLLYTLGTIAHFGNLALVENGFSSIDTEKYRMFVGDGAKVLIKRMLGEFGCHDQVIFDRVFRRYSAAYDADMCYGTMVYDGIVEMLDGLKSRGIRTAVLTNKPHTLSIRVLEYFLHGKFDTVYGARERYPHKPDPTAAFELIDELGVKPDEVLYAGDSGTDMLTGKNAGFLTVGVLWGYRGREELGANGADHIVASPREILDLIK